MKEDDSIGRAIIYADQDVDHHVDINLEQAIHRYYTKALQSDSKVSQVLYSPATIARFVGASLVNIESFVPSRFTRALVLKVC